MMFRHRILFQLGTRSGSHRLSSAIASTISNYNAHCVDLVKTSDYENYLIGLLMPKNSQQAFFAIRAFNIEIAVIKDQLPRNSFQAGKIRFQFWKDVLNGIYDESKSNYLQHPVAQAVRQAVVEKNLTKRWFERSLEAR